jgi:hypothetical protein
LQVVRGREEAEPKSAAVVPVRRVLASR